MARPSENQLIRVDRPGTVAEYRYDALGRRIEKIVNGVSTRYIYDNEDIVAEVDGTGTLRAFYLHGPGIDEPLAISRSGTTGGPFAYHADGLGSITTLTDLNGNPVRSYTYDSFGRIVAQTGTLVNPYTYTSRELDPESGLYYYRARYYDAITGRLLQDDPIKGRIDPRMLLLLGPLEESSYAFVQNNPVNLRDPSGLLTFSLGGTASAGTGKGGSVSLLVNFDLRGNVSVTITPAGGGFAGVAASAGGTIQLTNAKTVFDLEGIGATVGGSIGLRPGAGPFVGADIVLQPQAQGLSFTIGKTTGITPLEIHGFLGTTQRLYSFNIFDLFRSALVPLIPRSAQAVCLPESAQSVP
jgi:RHS repeat-associated protein